VTKALPFTEASLARAIKGVERAGRYVIGVRPDGTLIVGDKPSRHHFLRGRRCGTIKRKAWDVRELDRAADALPNQSGAA
jgi:hypothetical protein